MTYFGKYRYLNNIREALTIPDNDKNPVETLVRRELSKSEFSRFRYKDHVIRFCRYDDEEELNGAKMRERYIDGLEDLVAMFGEYDRLKAKARARGGIRVKVDRADGKTQEIDPVADFGKISRYDAFKQLLNGMRYALGGGEIRT